MDLGYYFRFLDDEWVPRAVWEHSSLLVEEKILLSSYSVYFRRFANYLDVLDILYVDLIERAESIPEKNDKPPDDGFWVYKLPPIFRVRGEAILVLTGGAIPSELYELLLCCCICCWSCLYFVCFFIYLVPLPLR